LVLHAPSQQGLQHALDQFSDAGGKTIKKINIQNSEVLCLSRNPSQFKLQVRCNTLQQAEKFKFFKEVITSVRKRNREIDTQIGKANTVLRYLSFSADKNGASKHCKSVTFS